jgi:hypothetical protein
MQTKMTLKASQEAGKISLGNTKMPSTTFAISAKHCGVGGKLVNIKGSTCNRCYALKLQNLRPSVDQGWTANLIKAVKMIENNPTLWAKQVAFQIVHQSKKIGVNHHRWFDSGDLQSVAMLHAICLACGLSFLKALYSSIDSTLASPLVRYASHSLPCTTAPLECTVDVLK